MSPILITFRPLEWSENIHKRQKECTQWYAETAWHDYWIEKKKKYHVTGLHTQRHTQYDTLEEAKEACQKDLYYRIMEHIDVQEEAS